MVTVVIAVVPVAIVDFVIVAVVLFFYCGCLGFFLRPHLMLPLYQTVHNHLCVKQEIDRGTYDYKVMSLAAFNFPLPFYSLSFS